MAKHEASWPSGALCVFYASLMFPGLLSRDAGRFLAPVLRVPPTRSVCNAALCLTAAICSYCRLRLLTSQNQMACCGKQALQHRQALQVTLSVACYSISALASVDLHDTGINLCFRQTRRIQERGRRVSESECQAFAWEARVHQVKTGSCATRTCEPQVKPPSHFRCIRVGPASGA